MTPLQWCPEPRLYNLVGFFKVLGLERAGVSIDGHLTNLLNLGFHLETLSFYLVEITQQIY